MKCCTQYDGETVLGGFSCAEPWTQRFIHDMFGGDTAGSPASCGKVTNTLLNRGAKNACGFLGANYPNKNNVHSLDSRSRMDTFQRSRRARSG